MNSQSATEAPIRTAPVAEPLPARIHPSRIVGFVATVQLILLSAHYFVYRTWVFFEGARAATEAVRISLFLLSLTFISATVLSHRYNNRAVRTYYKMAAVWLGFLNGFFLADCLSWVMYLATSAVGFDLNRRELGIVGFGLAVALAIYGFLRAQFVRVKRIKLNLPNVPRAWRGRVAAHLTDTHLGHIRGRSFLARIVRMLKKVGPDIVFITGDLYDGSRVDTNELVAPWRELNVPWGTYFVTGNHEEFTDANVYLEAVRQVGIEVLDNENCMVEGIDIIGVRYRDSALPSRLQAILARATRNSARPAILLTHSPQSVSVAAQSGISLQISGHTHAGQIFPFTYFTRRVFGEYTYGINRLGNLLVYTSSGAGTWGPPMRLGAPPEIVVFEF